MGFWDFTCLTVYKNDRPKTFLNVSGRKISICVDLVVKLVELIKIVTVIIAELGTANGTEGALL